MIQHLVAEARDTGYAITPGLLLPGSWGVAAVIGWRPRARGSPVLDAIEARVRGERQVELGRLLRP